MQHPSSPWILAAVDYPAGSYIPTTNPHSDPGERWDSSHAIHSGTVRRKSAYVLYYILHFTFTSSIGMGHAGSFSHSAEFSFFFFTCKRHQRQEGRVSVHTWVWARERIESELAETVIVKRALPCVLYIYSFILYVIGFTEGCTFSTEG